MVQNYGKNLWLLGLLFTKYQTIRPQVEAEQVKVRPSSRTEWIEKIFSG